MEYKFLANLQQEFALPEKGILSRVLEKNANVNVTLFGFSAGAIDVTSVTGTHRTPVWDGGTQMFSFIVRPSAAGTAQVRIAVRPLGAAPVTCSPHCGA